MQKNVITCDKCGKRVEYIGYFSSEGFKQIEIKFDDRTVCRHDLCPECLEKYGLPKKKDYEAELRTESTADKLYEVIAEIVAENQGGNC